MNLRVFTVTVLLMIGPACATTTPPPTKIVAVADVATKIESSANVILHAAMTANATIIDGKPFVSREALDQIAIGVNAIGRAGGTLNAALDDYIAVKAADGDVSEQTARILHALDTINTALAQVGHAIPNGTIQTIDQAVTTIVALLMQVKAGL